MATPQAFIINQTKISEQVYDYLHGEIISGRLAPGQRLDLDELVERLKISKMPIKEAIGRLATEGLLDIQARRGTYVGRVDARDLAETFEVRCALEMLAGELAVLRATKADINQLRQLITQMEASQDVGQHLDLNFQFHSLIVQLSDNRKLIEMYHRLRVPIQVAAIHYRSEDWMMRVAQEQKEHRAIVRALEQKDAEAVSRAISQHIKRGSESLLEDVALSQNAEG
ncbi:MAG: GntR family transcriptional regulator [Blastocatellia bacterium]|nr:GntR family transcriptional regulator [Blastocatellia bacterium]